MKITFLLPYAGMHGGIRVVAIYAQLLRDRGHQITVISVAKNRLSLRHKLRQVISKKTWLPIENEQGGTYFEKDDPSWIVLSHAGPITENDVPDSDVIIATWWKTAEWAHRLGPSKGIKVYFCQGYETHDIKYRKRVEATYFLPIKKICVSEWVRKKIEHLTGLDDQETLQNGVDLKQFYCSTKVVRDRRCFGFLFSDEATKGSDIIIEALELAKAQNPLIKAIAFGSSRPSKRIELPSWIEFYENPPQEFIREIYSRCTAWIFGSRAEGFGLPILEAMACKTPVIATRAGAAPDLVLGSCGYLIPVEDPVEMANKIIEVSKLNSVAWAQKSRAAYEVACHNDWESSCSRLVDILSDLLKISRL